MADIVASSGSNRRYSTGARSQNLQTIAESARNFTGAVDKLPVIGKPHEYESYI